MTVRKCKECKGRGFIFEKSIDIKLKNNGGFSMREIGLKMQCVKCFGKGVK
ncbi:hypothetical protein P4195_29845 [Bacillus thuringiensis]|uniref:hypothetical protein n=1 Tax=Bacillus cereus TaxID=1396 RepID=UPI002DBDE47E|nr:hypothetical protein [Bacillus cereus]MED2684053.1 hypothetical protein [Bacillus thuringiensis]